jgi:pSer/pThr/pTyr-binding forkhead associated (FHA) protein
VPLSTDPRHATATELQDRLAAERAGAPFLVYRDATARQRIVALDLDAHALTVGRDPGSELSLSWDSQVSRLHARLERLGSQWTVQDDGLSRNGSFVNGDRIHGRHKLSDGDVMRFGATTVLFRAPRSGGQGVTAAAPEESPAPAVSEAQRRVLVALCRPYKDAPAFATPATNQRVAEELFLSLESVKSHMRALFAKFGLEELPQHEKRVRLVERALQSGVVSEQEL